MEKNILKYAICVIAAVIIAAAPADAQLRKGRLFKRQPVDSLQAQTEMLIYKGDTVPSILYSKRQIGRFDRELKNYLVVPKKTWDVAITANYYGLDAQDYRLLSYITNLSFKGQVLAVNPSISYFFKHNQSIGIRGGFSKYFFDLDNFNVDIDEDINFNLKDIYYHQKSFSAAIFYRNYIGLDAGHRFAVFNEIALQYSHSTAEFQRMYDGVPSVTNGVSDGLRLNFSPGVSVFINEHASFNLSFGVFGWYFSRERQHTTGGEEVSGSTTTSGANFKINLFNLAFGIAIYI